MKRFFSNKNFTVGFVLTSVVVITALISLFWTPYNSNRMNARARLQAPSLSHPLGTDHYGRDTLSRVMVGAVNSIIVGLVTVAIGLSLGVLLGLASAYYGSWVDESIMRFSDLLFGFPAVLTAILITSILGPSIINAMLAIGIFYIPVFARLTRAGLLEVLSSDYIRTARAKGVGAFTLITRHALRPALMPAVTYLGPAFAAETRELGAAERRLRVGNRHIDRHHAGVELTRHLLRARVVRARHVGGEPERRAVGARHFGRGQHDLR